MPSFPALRIERLTVRADRIMCDVVVDPRAPRLTDPLLAARICATFPDLPRHACVNDEGDTFAAVMGHTSLPHMLEHLVVDLQSQAEPLDSEMVFVGTTEWADSFSGRARIEVNFTDDMVALRCFRDAVAFLNEAVVL